MGKHAKDDGNIMPLLDTKKLVTGKVVSNDESVRESVRVIDESIAKHPIPPATVKE